MAVHNNSLCKASRGFSVKNIMNLKSTLGLT